MSVLVRNLSVVLGTTFGKDAELPVPYGTVWKEFSGTDRESIVHDCAMTLRAPATL